MTDTLTTARLTLRRISMDDAPAMHAIFADTDAMRYWSRLPHTDVAETEAWIAKTIASNESGEGDDFVVIRDGALVGRVGIWQNNELGLISRLPSGEPAWRARRWRRLCNGHMRVV
ncbi:MAG: GNAT family N-acetyltransferase [Rhizomicrobium sp.]